MNAGAHPRREQPQALVSFLIVSYNAGVYLKPCLESAFQQSYQRIEVVLVDNASTDGSVDKAAQDLAGKGGLKVVRSATNLGPAGGAVLGLPHCDGEFIARQDADDIALPERIGEQVRYLRRHPRKDAVGADVMRVNANGIPWALGLSLRTNFLRRYASKWEMGCLHTTLMVRRTVALERFYNPTLFTSGDFEWIEWFARDGRLGLAPKILCLYRQHSRSITRRLGNLQRLTSCELKSRLSPRAGRDGRRMEVFKENFGGLLNSTRLAMGSREQAQAFEAECRMRKDWIAAAYFASIGGRWRRVPLWLLRALAAGESPKEVFAFGLCRTVWPVWQRAHNLGFRVVRLVATRQPVDSSAIETSFRLARSINRLRIFH